MTVMLLALLFSDAALSAAEASEGHIISGQADGAAAPATMAAPARGHVWTPRVESWSGERTHCPVFFQSEVAGLGVFRLGPRCSEPEDYPHAL